MADKVSLIITVEGENVGDPTRQRTIQYVSNTATDQQLYDFCTAYVALTNENPKGFAKVTRKELVNNG